MAAAAAAEGAEGGRGGEARGEQSRGEARGMCESRAGEPVTLHSLWAWSSWVRWRGHAGVGGVVTLGSVGAVTLWSVGR